MESINKEIKENFAIMWPKDFGVVEENSLYAFIFRNLNHRINSEVCDMVWDKVQFEITDNIAYQIDIVLIT